MIRFNCIPPGRPSHNTAKIPPHGRSVRRRGRRRDVPRRPVAYVAAAALAAILLLLGERGDLRPGRQFNRLFRPLLGPLFE